MVSLTAGPLTKIGFRRDLKLFLWTLVGFLVFLIALLLLMLQGFLQHAQDATVREWRIAADTAATEVASAGLARDANGLVAQLAVMQPRLGIIGLTVERKGQKAITAGVPPTAQYVQSLVRRLPDGTLSVVFDATAIRAMKRTFWSTAVISLLAAALGVLFLQLYLPRITGPIEAMLESAAAVGARSPRVDEQQYLIETFQGVIARMKEQEVELHRLHDEQKVRADDLERVTAALTRSIPSGFLAVNPEGRIVDANSVAREMLLRAGGAGAEVSGAELVEAFGDNEFTAAILDALRSRSAIGRAEVTLRGEEIRTIGLTTVPLSDDGGTFFGMLALFTDLTPLRRLETRIREMQSLSDLGETAAGIAHEFRNSLSTILGYLHLTRRQELPAAAARCVESAEHEASLLSGAVDGMLAFAGPMRLTRQPTDLLALLQDIVARAEAQYADVPIAFDGEPAFIEADAAVLTRAFENLVRNAAESVAEKGSGDVRVTVRSRPYVAVRIEDTGLGLDPADVPRLFLPFQSNKRSGFGLGLPLVKKIILLHEGSVSLTGEAGAGATALVEFATAAAAAQPESVQGGV